MRGRQLDREILRLGAPALGALAADPVVSLVDTAFVGQLGKTELGALGVSVAVFSIAFFLSGILGGITGYLLGMTYTVDPFIGSMILKGIIAAIIGGMGSLGGGAIAGILLGAVESLLIAEIGASLTPIVVYSSIIVLLLIRPEGIAGKRYVVKA